MKFEIFIAALGILIFSFAYFLSIQKIPIKPDINFVSFDCIDDGGCELISVECCNNNNPNQNTCIGKKDASGWNMRLQEFCTKNPSACPEYYREGSYSCFCEINRCWTNFTSRDESKIYTGIGT